MGKPQYECLVVGLGVMGAACCRALTKRGCRVLGIDRFKPGNDRGSSHGKSRIFRVGYFEHADYVPLLKVARRMWLDLQREAGLTLFHPVGGLWMGPPDAELIAGTIASCDTHSLRYDVLSNNDLRKRYPHIRLGTEIVGFMEQDAGMLLPELAIQVMTSLAERKGAELHTAETVRRWEVQHDRVVVETDRATYGAERLILCPGPWASALLDLPSTALTVTRQPSAWFNVLEPSVFDLSRHPCWAVVRNDPGFYYGFPMRAGERSMKVSLHHLGKPCDADTVDREVHPAEIDLLATFLQRTFPNLFSTVAATSVCLYTNTSDGHFIVGRHPTAGERVTLACGFSGHGFKFAPVLGEAIADIALDGDTHHPVEFLGPDRFAVSSPTGEAP